MLAVTPPPAQGPSVVSESVNGPMKSWAYAQVAESFAVVAPTNEVVDQPHHTRRRGRGPLVRAEKRS